MGNIRSDNPNIKLLSIIIYSMVKNQILKVYQVIICTETMHKTWNNHVPNGTLGQGFSDFNMHVNLLRNSSYGQLWFSKSEVKLKNLYGYKTLKSCWWSWVRSYGSKWQSTHSFPSRWVLFILCLNNHIVIITKVVPGLDIHTDVWLGEWRITISWFFSGTWGLHYIYFLHVTRIFIPTKGSLPSRDFGQEKK